MAFRSLCFLIYPSPQPTQLVGQLEKAWPSLVMQAFSLVEDEKKRDRDEVAPQLDAETITKRDRFVASYRVRAD
jgi:hypothetical protein